MIKLKLLTALVLTAGTFVQAYATKPVWELGKNPLNPKMIQGNIELKNGVVEIDGENTFSIPASVLGNQNNYTIEFEIQRPQDTKAGHSIVVMSNQDDKNKTGIKFCYFPPSYNAIWVFVNGYQALEKRRFTKGGFNKVTFVIRDKQLMIFRDGMLLGMTGEVKPSTMPLTFGGIRNKNKLPQQYTLKNIKIYNEAITPTGFDPSIKRMRSWSGPGFKVDRVEIKDKSLPRILVIGDSISMGYRRYITKHYKGRAYVDYWVGGAWVNGPKSVLGKDSPVKQAWKGVLALGPYDVITWNPMGLHMWNPRHDTRTPVDKYPQMITEIVENIVNSKDKKTSIIWLNTTPFCKRGRKDGEYGVIDRKRSVKIIKCNKISTDIMKKYGISEIDMWSFCEKNMDKVSKDGVHWSSTASKMMADMIIKQIDKYLPVKK